MKHTMKKSHIEELKYLRYRMNIPVSDYNNFTNEKYIRLEYLKSLRKIIKLKNSNRILCAKRKSLISKFNKYHTTTIKGVDIRVLSSDTHDSFIFLINKISEEIGKNTYKIQKLRTEYKQLEKQLKSEI